MADAMKIPTSFIYVIDGISSCNLVTDVINLLLPICLSVRHAITKASQAEWEEQEKRVENARAFDPCCQATGQVTVNFVSCSPLLRRLPPLLIPALAIERYSPLPPSLAHFDYVTSTSI